MNTGREKLIQLIVYLAQEVPDLYITKLLKMLYLIDETAILRYGIQVTWLDYNAWEFGPVIPDLYKELKNKTKTDLFNYIQTQTDSFGELITTKQRAEMDLFSANEMEIIDEVIEKYKNWNANNLVELLHTQGTLWSKVIENHNVIFTETGKSNYHLNFSDLIKDKPLQKMFYAAARESIEFNEMV